MGVRACFFSRPRNTLPIRRSMSLALYIVKCGFREKSSPLPVVTASQKLLIEWETSCESIDEISL